MSPKFCSNEILTEIIFDFLDNITYLCPKIKNKNNGCYYLDSEKISVIHSYVNGLIKFYREIWSNRDKYKDAKILESSYNISKKFIIGNPLVKFSESQQLLESCIFEEDTTPFMENIFSNNNINMDLVMLAISELENRKISTITRSYSKYDNNLAEKVYTSLLDAYMFTKDKLKLTENQSLSGKYTIYYFEELNKSFCLKYDVEENLDILFVNEKKDRYEKIKTISNQTGQLKNFSRIRCPLYNLVRLLVNIGCIEAQGVKFKFISETFYSYNLKDLPVLNTLIK